MAAPMAAMAQAFTAALEPLLDKFSERIIVGLGQTILVGEEYAIRMGLSDIAETLNKELNLGSLVPQLDNISKILKPLGTVAYMDDFSKKVREANQALGIGGELTRVIERNVFQAHQNSVLLGIEQEKIVATYKEFYNATSRNVLLSVDELEQMTLYMEAYGSSFSDVFGIMRLYGQSIEDTGKFLEGVQRRSNEMGLNTKKVLDSLAANMSVLDRFSFKNGIDGLSKMVTLSERYKFNMASTESVLNNFISLDKVMESTANLMTLGGDLANIADPFTLMATARSNPEELMEQMFTAASRFATRGERGYEIDAYGMDIIREYAQIIGASVEEITKAAKIKKIEDDVAATVSRQIRSMENFDDVLSKISGSAFFKDGVLGINVQGEEGTVFKAISDLNQTDLDALDATTEGNDVMRDLLITNRSISDTITDILKFLERNIVSDDMYMALDQMTKDFVTGGRAEDIVASDQFQKAKDFLRKGEMEMVNEEFPKLFEKMEYGMMKLIEGKSHVERFINSAEEHLIDMFSNASFMGSIPSFATGGIISEPLFSLVGDNPNAKKDPEVVAPLSDLESIISNTTLFKDMGNMLSQSERMSRNESTSEKKMQHSFDNMNINISVSSDGTISNIDNKELSRRLVPVIEEMVRKGIRDENVNQPRYNPVGKTLVS